MPCLTHHREHLLTKLGLRFGTNGAHAARTMMLADITTLLDCTPPKADRAAFACAVVDANCLGKPSKSARSIAFRHLAQLYGLDPSLAVYRAFRKLWSFDRVGRPMLALLVALARDPLLRANQDEVLSLRVGEMTNRERLERHLLAIEPNRFSLSSLRSMAQNINGTWTEAGVLEGRVAKQRATPRVSPEAATFALFLAHLEGRSGQRLFSSAWVAALAIPQVDVASLATAAHQRGLLDYLSGGGVQEVRFPGYLTPVEAEWQREIAHVQGG